MISSLHEEMNWVAANHVTVPSLSMITLVLYFSGPPVNPVAALYINNNKNNDNNNNNNNNNSDNTLF